MNVAIVLGIIAIITRRFSPCSGANCIWGSLPPPLGPNSALSNFIGKLKVMPPKNYDKEKGLLCQHSYDSILQEGIWNCELPIEFGPETNLRILECGDHANCSAHSPFPCEDNYCINPCASDPICSASNRTNSSEDCRLDPYCFISWHWNHNPTCLYGCTRDGNCSDDEACIFNRCKSPCDTQPCGSNNECAVENHKTICTCVNGTSRGAGWARGDCHPPRVSQQTSIVECFGKDDYDQVWKVDVGGVGSKPCPSSANGTATWECQKNGIFATRLPNYTNCSSHWVDTVVADSKKIVGKEDAIRFFDKLATDTADENKTNSLYFGEEIPKIVNATLKAIANFGLNNAFQELSPILTKSLESSDNLLKSRKQWNQLHEKTRLAVLTELTNSFEFTAILLAKTFNETKSEHEQQTEVQVVNTTTMTVKLGTVSTSMKTAMSSHAHVVDDKNSESQTNVELDFGGSGDVAGNGSVKYIAVFLDGKTAQNPYQGSDTRANEPNSSTISNKQRLINGKVVFVTLIQSEPNGERSHQSTKENTKHQEIRIHDNATITVTFHHGYKTWGSSSRDIRRRCGGDPSAVLGSGSCAYWDLDNLTWSSVGCSLVESTTKFSTCRCNHLSTFTLLMDSHNCVGEDIVLETITLIFCSLSAISLLLTIIAFSLAKSASRDEGVITKHLCFYLMFGNVILIFAVDRSLFLFGDTSCAIVGVMAHFVYTHAFMWMAVEGCHIYGMFYRIGKLPKLTLNGYKILCALVSIAIIVVTIVVGVSIDQSPYGNEAVCWINDGFIWGFNSLVAVVLLLNFIVLGLAIHIAYNRGNTNLPSTKKTNYKKLITGSLFLTILLGCTWIFGYFMLLPGIYGHIAAYVFTIFCATQGIFIFVYYCIMDANNIRSDLAKLYSRYKQTSALRFTLDTR